MLTNIINYCKDTYNELVHKTTWPNMNQLTSQAVLVLVASVIIALLVFATDKVFELVMKFVYSLF